MPAKIWSAALNGLDAQIITVEASSGGGDFGNITIVGLPDTAVSESKERVRCALRVCGLPFPRRKITVNLSPADLKKRGPAYDLPIAISILSINNSFKVDLSKILFLGELSLNGEIRPVNGLLSVALAAKENLITTLVIPKANAEEAALVSGLNLYAVSNLQEVLAHLLGKEDIPIFINQVRQSHISENNPDLSEIIGQEKAKRVLEIAAAGRHNILLSGPPGAGKTMLARALPGILPDPNDNEKLEISRIRSAVGESISSIQYIKRPFRSPHHSTTIKALLGGGIWPHPGEISLAHRGVLFLDEFPEFPRQVIEGLRQPLEEGSITISRCAAQYVFPANFILFAAMNPCPCGYLSAKNKNCECTDSQIRNYRRRLSGPILDRIDLHLSIKRVNYSQLSHQSNVNNTTSIRARINMAHAIQQKRFQGHNIHANSEIPAKYILKWCKLDNDGTELLQSAGDKLKLSARSYHKIIKIARTIADLSNIKMIRAEHLAEALQYRPRNL